MFISDVLFPHVRGGDGHRLSGVCTESKDDLDGKDLQTSDAKVIDVAFQFGYSSFEVFSRTFKSVDGGSPSLVKEVGIQLKSYGKLAFNLSINGNEEINYRIEKKDAFSVIGLVCHTSEDDRRNYAEIPAFWTEVNQDGGDQNLCEFAGTPDHCFGMCMDYDVETNEFDYWVAVVDERGEQDDDNDYAKRVVEAAT
jgi:AraC family transcriptional regulator